MLPKARNKDSVFNPSYTLWFWCSHCMVRKNQKFIRDDGIYEIYQCSSCYNENKKAVR